MNIAFTLLRVKSGECICFTMIHTQPSIRAIIAPLPGMPEGKQRTAAGRHGHVVPYSIDQREAWLRALGPGQVGWCWRLSWLAVPAGGAVLPIADYATVIADLSRRIGEGARVILGDDGIDSDDRSAWLRAVSDGALQVRSGRKLTSREMARRGAKGTRIMQERSTLQLLRTSHSHKLAVVRGLWRSTEYPNREARAEAINAEMRGAGLAELGSWQTIWRALKKLERAK